MGPGLWAQALVAGAYGMKLPQSKLRNQFFEKLTMCTKNKKSSKRDEKRKSRRKKSVKRHEELDKVHLLIKKKKTSLNLPKTS